MVAKHPKTRANAIEFGRLLRARAAALGFDRTSALKTLQDLTESSYEAARKYWEGEMIPRHWRLERIAKWLGITAGELLPVDNTLHAAQPAAQYEVANKRNECLRLFSLLPPGIQDHMIIKMTDLVWYLDQLPDFLKQSIRPPSENYSEWEKQVETDMQRLKSLR